jgi:hypothetical protein
VVENILRIRQNAVSKELIMSYEIFVGVKGDEKDMEALWELFNLAVEGESSSNEINDFFGAIGLDFLLICHISFYNLFRKAGIFTYVSHNPFDCTP